MNMSIWVVPYIGTWIETSLREFSHRRHLVVPYIGTWIETTKGGTALFGTIVVPYIGTWIETLEALPVVDRVSRTLYRYVD